MGLFGFLKGKDINAEVNKFNKTKGAVLLDVRDRAEYSAGHIPGAVNVPEKEISSVASVIPDLNTPVFVYCLSGARSWNAEKIMKDLGYKNVKNIGGISKYTGPKEMQL